MEKRIVMITGSGMGIGLACAEAFAREEATVIMADIQKPEEIADAVLWLCSPASSFVHGHALLVDGGFTIH